MSALLLLLGAWWIASGLGSVALRRCAVLQADPLERFVYASALGLGIAAYGVFALGLCGLLSFWPVTLWWITLALIGLPGMAENWRSGVQAFRRSGGVAAESPFHPFTLSPFLFFLIVGVLLLCGVVAVIACFQPPGGREWDALAYHLAHPKVFLAQHRILSLPTEHQSNFPFTMEMLYTVGLLYNGYALANLFHCLMGVLTVLALIAFCRRTLSPPVGLFAALLFATTPLVLWEAHVAYIELGLGLFTTLSTFAAMQGVGCRVWGVGEDQGQGGRDKGKEASRGTREQGTEPNPTPYTLHPTPPFQWLLLAGAMMGFALGIKYLALLPFVLVGGVLLVHRVPLRQVAAYAGVALLIGSPWYIKNAILTRNPVYPYFYSIFSGSRYWSADRAKTYQSEQSGFGVPRSPDGSRRNAEARPDAKARALVQLPWYLLTMGNVFDNPGNFTFLSQLGGLFAAFGFGLVFLRRVPPLVRDLMLLALVQVIAWFFVAQVSRYLVSILPLLAVGAGYFGCWVSGVGCRGKAEGEEQVLVAQGQRSEGESSITSLPPHPLTPSPLLSFLVGAALVGQVGLAFWGVFGLPTSVRETPPLVQEGLNAGAQMAWTGLTSISVPETVSLLTQSEGAESVLHRTLDIYPAMQWINKHTSKEAGVILYEETRGFYLDRPYLWGNGEHASYIPYEMMRSGADLTAWLQKEGIRYALINLKFSPENGRDPDLPQGPNGNEEAALQRWYAETKSPPGTWRYVLGEALRGGDWRMVQSPELARRGVVVLEIPLPISPTPNAQRPTPEKREGA